MQPLRKLLPPGKRSTKLRLEDGSILIHRNGARTDSQLLEPSFLAQLLSHENQELLNRPAKAVSMLAGSMVFGGPGTGANGIGARAE